MNVVITGATKGIGRAIAEKFAENGYCIIACSRTQSDLDLLVENFNKRFPGISIFTKAVDTGNATEVKKFGNWIIENSWFPDILVNNVGYFIPGSIHTESEETLQKMMEVNVYSSYHLTRTLLPPMIEKKQGHIFNICSIASFTPLANVGSYGISKFALYGLTKNLREEMKPFGIKVTAVSPGSTFSSSWEGSDVDPTRIMEVDDVAKMVFASSQLSKGAAVEDIVLRPQSGDL